MSHTISGVASALLPQIMFGVRTNSASAKKAAKPFQTIDSDGEISLSQQRLKYAVTRLTAAEELPSSDVSSTVERMDLRGPGTASGHDSTDVLAGLSRSLNDADSATGSSGLPTSVPKNSSLKSLESLGSQTTTNGGPGSIVNVLI